MGIFGDFWRIAGLEVRERAGKGGGSDRQWHGERRGFPHSALPNLGTASRESSAWTFLGQGVQRAVEKANAGSCLELLLPTRAGRQ